MNRTTHSALRRAVVATARALGKTGLSRGTSGNVSARVAGGLLITPSGMAYSRMRPESIVRLRFDGSHDGKRAPSSEWRFHRDILRRREEVGAVVHAHPPFATALACAGREIPAFHYMVAVAGGDSIRCAAYATFGTQKLSDNALRALDGRRACLLANHGMIAVGADLDAALALAVEVETLAEQYCRALQVGRPTLLPATEMTRVLKKFESYGRTS